LTEDDASASVTSIKEQPDRIMNSPIRLLVVLIVSVFAAELSIMIAFALFPPFPRWMEDTLDASLLVILLFPILYYWVFRPLSMLIAQHVHMSTELELANRNLLQEAAEREKVVEEMAALNDELVAITKDAESANRAKSTFMANISHEIRTPLHVIIGLGHLLRRTPANAVQRQRLDQLCSTSEHLLFLVNDILDLSKIEADHLVLDDSTFRFGSVVDRVQEVLSRLAADKGLALEVQVAPVLRGAMLRGDPLRLTQVLINLGSNAVKFSDQGVIRLGLAALEENEASLSLCFTVQDNGIGIASEDQSRIFRRFEQVDDTITRKYGGTGLGLTICQRLVSMMGGSIRLDSQPGMGSTFSFDLTLRKSTGAPEETGGAAAAADLAGTRVLVAEDHPLSQEIILEMLEDLGCYTDIATNGIEAVECARERAYDLVLMDMQMPKMDGLKATRAIRALPGYHDTPIIALTANAFVEDRQRGLDAGMNGHISKPVTPASLAAALSQWLPGLAVPGGEEPSFESELSLALLDIPGLDVGPAWRRSPERLADYRGLLDRFVKLHGRDMAQLREHFASGNHDAAHAVAHTLKGIAGLLGAREVESLTAELVQALRSGADRASILSLASACETELNRLTEAARTLPGLPAES
jgi:two-component system sensor histidine kinase/response regulator